MGCSSAPLNAPDGGKADRIVIVKSKHSMVLMANGKPLKSYHVALGKSDGAKERQGDHKTPEGEYVIDQKNAQSRFHLALHVSYPNAADRKRAHDAGVDPGGAIMIHGVEKQFAWLGPLQHDIDWTDGCIAVTNREMDEVWQLVPVGTPVEIKP
jgi:murein L,D-transpeptidase YafK